MSTYSAMSRNPWLKALGIGTSELDIYDSCFLSPDNKFLVKTGKKSSWIPDKEWSGGLQTITNLDALEFLTGHHHIRLLSPPMMNYFAISFGRNLMQQEYESIKTLTKLLGKPIIDIPVYSRHCNCIFFMKQYEKSKKICTVLDIQLKKFLIDSPPHVYTFFPCPGGRFELPFGKGSIWLDPESLQPKKLKLKTKIQLAVATRMQSPLTDIGVLINLLEGMG